MLRSTFLYIRSRAGTQTFMIYITLTTDMYKLISDSRIFYLTTRILKS